VIGCLESGLFVNDVLNIGSDVEHRVIDLAKLILRLTGSKSPVQHLPPLKEGDMTRRKPDLAKMRQVLRRPLLPVEEGIRRLLAFKAREAGS
jgi:UDP-glucuronate decarboxylase